MIKETPEQEAKRLLQLTDKLSNKAIEGLDLLLDDESEED